MMKCPRENESKILRKEREKRDSKQLQMSFLCRTRKFEQCLRVFITTKTIDLYILLDMITIYHSR